MKHPLATTLLLVGLFLVSQLIGLALINLSIVDVVVVNGTTVLNHTSTAIGERPDLAGYQSFLYLAGGVFFGTVLLLLLIRFRKVKLWKFWFFLAVFLATSVAFGVVLPQLVALGLALVLALLKVYRPNPWVHNLSELFIYPGIAVLLVPLFDVYWMLLVLLAISVYDIIAVWRTKHMVAMAQFQSQSEMFAGLMVPRKAEPLPAPPKGAAAPRPAAKTPGPAAKRAPPELPSPAVAPAARSAHAILGGGDVAFPMLFAGVVMEGLLLSGVSRTGAFLEALIVVAFAAVALTLLFVFAKKDRFYPAMPFLSAGCVLGWLVTLLV